MTVISEHQIQNDTRLALSKHKRGVYWRANVGQAWTGNRIERNPDGSITIYEPRPFQTGLPPGFTDLFGMTFQLIRPAHVGQTLPIYTGIEIKRPGKKPSDKQRRHLELLTKRGAIAGVATSPEEALALTLYHDDKA
ncbi:VRR-NUC domain-containing protein [Vreelandella alkaliphila]|uniref:VRR-NUC domain-containing protein n=1 Tax=Vreelandella alkaliphila TaxID=272774 RepID=A0AAJ2RXJ2_9GAMM|nr:VRR-NUC domain-containing protein [Halomonas alkaliphila]MDX5979581.1 VRR-NUC domain-containing protein [Halomonas alkaliphila]